MDLLQHEILFKNAILSHLSHSELLKFRPINKYLKLFIKSHPLNKNRLYYQFSGYYGPYVSLDEANYASGRDSDYSGPDVITCHLSMIEDLDRRLIAGIEPQSHRESSALTWFSKISPSLLGKTVSVVEFGGGIGIAAALLSAEFPMFEFKYKIIDQPWLVEMMSNSVLQWSPNLDISFSSENVSTPGEIVDVLFSSCAMHYLPDAHSVIRAWRRYARFVVIDRFPISNKGETFVANQVTGQDSYNSTYPAHYYSWDWLYEVFEIKEIKGFVDNWIQPEDNVVIIDKTSGHIYDSFQLRGFLYSTQT